MCHFWEARAVLWHHDLRAAAIAVEARRGAKAPAPNEWAGPVDIAAWRRNFLGGFRATEKEDTGTQQGEEHRKPITA